MNLKRGSIEKWALHTCRGGIGAGTAQPRAVVLLVSHKRTQGTQSDFSRLAAHEIHSKMPRDCNPGGLLECLRRDVTRPVNPMRAPRRWQTASLQHAGAMGFAGALHTTADSCTGGASGTRALQHTANNVARQGIRIA